MGFPAAVGMRAEVTSKAATIFSGEFHRSLGEVIRASAAAGVPSSVIEWVSLLTRPRQKICTQLVGTLGLADTISDWIYPVLYVRKKRFELTHVPTDANQEQIIRLTEQLQTLRTSRDSLAANGIPQSFLDSVDAEIARVQLELVGLT